MYTFTHRSASVALALAAFLGLLATHAAHASERSISYSYNSFGLVSSIDGPRTDVADITSYGYDSQGRLTSITNALAHVTRIVSRDVYGRPSMTRDANGLESQLIYDESGRLIERHAGGRITTMAYDAVGNLITITAPGGGVMHYEYDAANRVVAIRDGKGNTITYTLDLEGNRTAEEVFDADSKLTRTQSQVFDELSRLLQSIGASGQRTTYSYDKNDNLTDTLDPRQQLHHSSYDALNRLIAQTDPLQGITGYGYDSADNLTSVTDPNGNTTTYLYDGLGNLLEHHSPDTGTTTYTHDAAGNVVSKTDNAGQTTAYRYDALNRLTQATYADGSEVVYEYDTADNGIGRLARISDSSGETAWRYDSNGQTTGRIQTITVNGITHTLSTDWQYDGAGQLAGVTYPSGMQVGYAYVNGKISDITVNGQPLLSAIGYQPFGPVSGWQWSNGSAHQRGYDLDGRLASQSLGNNTRTLNYDVVGNISVIDDISNTQYLDYDALSRLTSASDATFNLGWGYDANGNRLSEVSESATTGYIIDSASNQLLAVGEAIYQHDANGNLIHDGSNSYSYDAQERLITIDEGVTGEYSYNALGQRVYKWGMMKNAANPDLNGDGIVTQSDIQRLQEYIRKGESPVSADLNGDGVVDGKDTPCIATLIGDNKNNGKGNDKGAGKNNKKSEKVSEQGRHACLPPAMPQQLLFTYDEHRLLGEYDMTGKAVQETVWLGNLPVATIHGGSSYYIHADHLGTPRVITDNSNMEVWRWDSDPFGVAEASGDPDGDGQSFTYNLRFPGQYYDAETGKHYNYFRDYDPGTGKYIQSDPAGLDGGLNTYAYVSGRPVNLIDPLGLAEWDPDYWRQQLGQVSSSTNCYGYALNRMSHTNPGSSLLLPRATCSNLIEGAKADGLLEAGDSASCGGDCPDGYYKIQIYLDDTNVFDRDYHVYRQDDGGSWSHKRGRGNYPQQEFSCPMSLPRSYGNRNYSKYCGTLCKKD